MKSISATLFFLSLLSLLSLLASHCRAQTPTYFLVNTPIANSTWTNGGLNVVTWSHSADGIDAFDMQLARKSGGGVLPIAKHIPSNWGAFNIVLQDTPSGTNYYIIFLNSEDSSVFSLSPSFSILANGTASTVSPPKFGTNVIPTVTVSGSPNPTMQFAATYTPSGATSLRLSAYLMGSFVTLAMVSLML